MNEIRDWLWLLIGIPWLLFKVLPRLFRKRRESAVAPGPKARPTGHDDASGHKDVRHQQLDASEGDGRGFSSGPPPIVPK